MSSEIIETRTRILEATVQMLEEGQGRAVRMGDIAAAAGISRQAVYLHFASRTELLVAAAKHLDEVLQSDRRLAPSRAATSAKTSWTSSSAEWALRTRPQPPL